VNVIESIVVTGAQVFASQTRTSLSAPLVARYRPSGENLAV